MYNKYGRATLYNLFIFIVVCVYLQQQCGDEDNVEVNAADINAMAPTCQTKFKTNNDEYFSTSCFN